MRGTQAVPIERGNLDRGFGNWVGLGHLNDAVLGWTKFTPLPSVPDAIHLQTCRGDDNNANPNSLRAVEPIRVNEFPGEPAPRGC